MKIKFRGVRIDNGEFVYGDLLQKPVAKIVNEDGEFFITEESIALFCGYDDITGEEIYCGDAVALSRYRFYPPVRPADEPLHYVKPKKIIFADCVATVQLSVANRGNISAPFNFWLNSEKSDFRFCLLKNFQP